MKHMTLDKQIIAYLALYHAIHGNMTRSHELRAQLIQTPQHERTAQRDQFALGGTNYDQH